MRIIPTHGATSQLRRSFVSLAVGLLLAGCSSDPGATDPSVNEPPTNNSPPNSPPTVQTGRLMVWTSDQSPSPIAVVVDGQAVGTLTRYWTSAPACGEYTTGAAITLTLSAGSHVVAAYETQADGTWPASTVQVPAGGCLTYHLRP
jgi:hypothetical protein